MSDSEEKAVAKQRESFNPNQHLIQLKSQQGPQDYLPVKWRLRWFRDTNGRGQIIILKSMIDLDREVTKEVTIWEGGKARKVQKSAQGWAYYEVRVEDDHGAVAESSGSETAVDFDDFIEKAKTKATGRALAELGYGTQFTGDEFYEGERIVDSPVESKPQQQSSTTPPTPTINPLALPHRGGALPHPTSPPSPTTTKPVAVAAAKKTAATPAATTTASTTPTTTATAPPAVTATVKLAPRVQAAIDMKPEEIAPRFDALKAEFGPFAWKALVSQVSVPADETIWDLADKKAVTIKGEKWIVEGTLDAWKVMSITQEQSEYITKTAVKTHGSIDTVRMVVARTYPGKILKDFTRGEADHIIGILMDAELVRMMQEDVAKEQKAREEVVA